MVASDKLDILRGIETEDKFRQTVLLTLFDKMGLFPVHTHGSKEKGKDIVCKEENAFHIEEWIAIAAKVGRITGSTSGSGSFATVLNQVQEAFDYAYKDPVTKKNVSINKVLVVTNDEILQTAKEKIVDKLGMPGATHANVHFIGGEQLAGLIDEHWQDFWRKSADLLTDEDRMSEDAGLVLYVLARAHVLSQAEKKKKVEREMAGDRIVRQTGLPKNNVQTALTYLLQALYAESTKKGAYRLQSKKTVGYLLMQPDQIRVLFAIKDIADEEYRFTQDALLQESKKEVLSFAQPFVKRTLDELAKGGYVEKDESRGAGHFKLNTDMIDEERPYLERWLKHLGRVPTHKD